MAEGHEHYRGPSRCCAAEHPEDVLQKLRRSPPERQGYSTPNGWSGESERAFAQRQAAWQDALRREELLRQNWTS